MNDSKSIIRLCVYLVLMFYLCCLLVVNFNLLVNEGTFTFSPLGAFKGENLIVVIFLFIMFVFLVFSNLFSYLFGTDEKKAKELEFYFFKKNKLSGYSKWASEKDIIADKGIAKVKVKSSDHKAAGLPLISKNNNIWVDNGEYHSLVIGASGSGKTECIVKPLVNLLASNGESMVITDPKGEIYEYCGCHLKEMGYKIVVLDFRDPEKGNSWNPLSVPYRYYKNGNSDKAIELLDDVSLNILYEKNNNADPFWEKSAADYFSGLALGLFQDATEEQVNINSIFNMSVMGEQKLGPSTYAKEYFTFKGESSAPYISASNTITAPNETRGSILSTFSQKLKIFSTKENLSEMLSYSNFDMESIGREKTAVFLIIHDEKKTYHSLMTIFIKQCYETLIDVATKDGGKLKVRTNFILDEFANMPPLKDVDAMVTAARSRRIRFTFIIQNYAQLNDIYGEQVALTIRGNCGNLVYLISTEVNALKEISEMCGEVKSKDDEKTSSTPLVTISDLQKLKLFEAIIIRIRLNPFKTKFTPNFKMDWGYSSEKATIDVREKKPVQIFDIKEFVSNKKKENALNGNNDMGPNPFGGGGMNPFMSGPMGNPFGPSMGGNPFASSPFDLPIPKPNDSVTDSFSNKDIDDIIREMEKQINAANEEELKADKSDSTFSIIDEKDNVIKSNDKVDALFDIAEDDAFVRPLHEKPLSDGIDFNNVNNILNNSDIESLDETKEISVNEVHNKFINVDKDSVVLNEKIVPEDEFMDDFFDNN